MATYNFKTHFGHAVTIRTEVNDDYYFGIFADVEGQGENRWGRLEKKDGNTVLYLSPSDGRPQIGVFLPNDIAAAIEEEKKAACSKTGKIIIATCENEKGEVQFVKYGAAIAEPSFKGMVWYRMPERMQSFVTASAKGGEVYDMGGIEDDPSKWGTLYVTSDRGNDFQFTREADETLSMFGIESKDETWTLHLRIADLMTED